MDSLAAARVGLGGTVHRARAGRSAPRARDARRDRHGPRRLARPLLAAVAADGGWSASASRSRASSDEGWARPPGAEPRLARRAARRRLAGRSDPDARRGRQRRRPRWAGRASTRRGGRRGRRRLRGGRGRRRGRVTVGGRPLAARPGYAGEIGHMVVNPAARPARCGSFGCWETEIGERAMLVRAGRRRAAAERPWTSSRRRHGGRAGGAARASPASARGWASASRRWSTSSTRPSSCSAACSGGSIRSSGRSSKRRSSGVRCRLSRELVAGRARRSGVDAPMIGAAELAFEPMLADPAGWRLAPCCDRARRGAGAGERT